MYHSSGSVMRLVYISSARIPGEKANTYQVLQMCDAFVSQDVNIVLLYPRRVNTPAMRQVRDIQGYYELRNAFPMVSLPTLDWIWASERLFSRAPRIKQIVQSRLFRLLMASYSWSVRRYLIRHTADVYYTRSFEVLKAVAYSQPDLSPRTFYEIHDFPHALKARRKQARVLKQIGGVITITERLKELHLQCGIPSDRILVAPDGVDLRRFANLPKRCEARRQLGLPEDRALVCYTGHLYLWKGVDTLARTIDYLPSSYQICIVGGMPDDVAALREMIVRENLPRVQVVGYVPPSQVPLYMAAADVMVLPNSEQYEISRHYTSPLKLFEYMASGRPIVASDLPSVREVLDERNSMLVRPDDPKALAEGIHWTLEYPEEAQSRVQQAYEDVQQYTWKRRACRIIDFIQSSNP